MIIVSLGQINEKEQLKSILKEIKNLILDLKLKNKFKI